MYTASPATSAWFWFTVPASHASAGSMVMLAEQNVVVPPTNPLPAFTTVVVPVSTWAWTAVTVQENGTRQIIQVPVGITLALPSRTPPTENVPLSDSRRYWVWSSSVSPVSARPWSS